MALREAREYVLDALSFFMLPVLIVLTYTMSYIGYHNFDKLMLFFYGLKE